MLVVLPVAIPDFVVSFGWVSIAPLAARLLGADAGHDPGRLSARLPAGGRQLPRAPTPARRRWPAASGCGRVADLSRGSPWPRPRPAVLGGCLLVALALLAEYGAFEILRYQTFTTEIFTEFQVGSTSPPPAACRSSSSCLGLVLLTADGFGRGRAPDEPVRALRRRASATARGWVGPPCPSLAGFVAPRRSWPSGVPIGTLVYWLVQGGRTHASGRRLAVIGRLAQRRLQRRRRRAGHRGGAPGGPAVGAPSGRGPR